MRIVEGNEEALLEEDNIEVVKNEKRLLKSADDSEIKEGIDYAHFNFMMHAYFDDLNDILEDETKSAAHVLEKFWGLFYPYLEAEIKDKQAVLMKLDEVSKDADATVQMGFGMKFELDHAKMMLERYGLIKAYKARLKKQRELLIKNTEKLKEDGVIK